MVELNLIDMLPPSTKRMKEEQEIQRVLSQELNKVSFYQYRIQQNANIPSCDEYGISTYESDMGISPLRNDTLKQRISRCLLVWNNSLPYNWASLISLLDTVIGKDSYIADIKGQVLTVRYISSAVAQDEIYESVRERVPTKVGVTILKNDSYHFESRAIMAIKASVSKKYVLDTTTPIDEIVKGTYHLTGTIRHDKKYTI